MAMVGPCTPLPFKNFNMAIGPVGHLSPVSNTVHVQIVRFLDRMMNGQPMGFQRYDYVAWVAKR
jgi:hypothetical protein